MTQSSLLGLRTCIYSVYDLQRAKGWYQQVTGQPPYFDEPFYVGFNVGGFELGLLPKEVDDGTEASGPGGVRTYWGVEDVEAEYKRLLELGATEHEAPHGVGGPLIVATVLDPFGNIFGLIYNPAFAIED